MTVDLAVFMGQQALMTTLLVSGPVLLTVLVVGSGISILQTVTQIQEMTLVFVPKILAVFLVMAVAGAWMLQTMVAYGENTWAHLGDEEDE